MLFNFICQLESYSEAIVLHYMAQLTDALNWLHQRNVAHLDIKPENILVCPTSKMDAIDYKCSSAIVSTLQNPHLKLIDFGDAFTAINRNANLPPSNLEFSAPEVLIRNTALGTATGNNCSLFFFFSQIKSMYIESFEIFHHQIVGALVFYCMYF